MALQSQETDVKRQKKPKRKRNILLYVVTSILFLCAYAAIVYYIKSRPATKEPTPSKKSTGDKQVEQKQTVSKHVDETVSKPKPKSIIKRPPTTTRTSPRPERIARFNLRKNRKRII
jgi:cytoskeletal protein RodZ